MRYLINRKTKEHKVLNRHTEYATCDWQVVQADSEGWIKHEGNVCPLPDDCLHEVKDRDGFIRRSDEPQLWDWYKDGTPSDITHYRPILAKKAQEPDYDPRSVSFKPKRLFDDLLERLEASHNAAQALPDLVAQLRDRLKPLGLGVMYLSEFDAMEPEAAVEQDMNDWRNWREGDLVQYTGQPHAGFSLYCLYGICELLSALCIYDDDGDDRPLESNAYRFRFHSRPAQQRHGAEGEK